jgi:hypothetical protein
MQVNDHQGKSVSYMSLAGTVTDVIGVHRSLFSLSRRERATPLRHEIEMHIANGEVVEIDFGRIEATQSFIDELVGLIVLERGPSVLNQLRFKRCSTDMKAILHFVVADRAAQHTKDPHFFAPR